MKRTGLVTIFFIAVSLVLLPILHAAEQGEFTYDDFDEPKQCSMCHKEIFEEWQQSLMSQSFTHPWDDVEYFRLALPHALKLEKVAEGQSRLHRVPCPPGVSGRRYTAETAFGRDPRERRCKL